jgi:2-polyprenyl-6-hydroxyphenyl methylase/3-demethylubiquinone-9 3-methyltransferase
LRADILRGMAETKSVDPRFGFGENWRKFLEDVTEDRIQEAERSLRAMLGLHSLAGTTFLDVGCGSGLFSLAAVHLGAERVHSLDYDTDSVAATSLLREREAPSSDWTIERGDILDADYVSSLGEYDVVYAWGVLHHTGAMWGALHHTCERVAPGGMLFVSIYNDQGPKSYRWRRLKRFYNRLPRPLRMPYVVGVMLPRELRILGASTLRGRPRDYVRRWTRPRVRGMSYWHDLVDWVGGYPFEVAKPEEVFHFCRDRNLELVELETVDGGLGCNQFVFRRRPAGEVPTLS